MLDKKLEKLIKENIIVIYDGMCGFCDSSIQFILDNEPSEKLRFVAFQSEIGQLLVAKFKMETTLDSIILIENQKYFKKSKAIFRILKYVNSRLSYLQYLNLLPTKLIDFGYDIIAKYRYKLVAQKCRLLSEKERGYFLN